MPDRSLDASGSWRTIDELARRVGGYCWQEHRVFELTGQWASGTGRPDIRVLCSEMSARHAACAARWRDRLPVRAGVDVGALVVPPASVAGAFTLLDGQPDLELGLGGLVDVVLPHLLSTYRAHLAGAPPVSEAPVIEVLRLITGAGEHELAQGRALLPADPDRTGEWAEFRRVLERSFEDAADKSPAARAS